MPHSKLIAEIEAGLKSGTQSRADLLRAIELHLNIAQGVADLLNLPIVAVRIQTAVDCLPDNL